MRGPQGASHGGGTEARTRRGSGPQGHQGDQPRHHGGLGGVGVRRHLWRSREPVALDDQEPEKPQRGVGPPGLRHRPREGRPPAQGARLQPAAEPEGPPGGGAAHRPRRPVRLHQRQGQGLHGGWPAGNISRRKEKGAGGQLRQQGG